MFYFSFHLQAVFIANVAKSKKNCFQKALNQQPVDGNKNLIFVGQASKIPTAFISDL